ncbi:ATPase, partial [Brachyspira intermedia]
AEGKKEGIEIGIQQGIEKGYKESQINIAKEMKKENMNIDVISRITGLSIEEIKDL